MKSIQTLELNEDLAKLKTMEHTIIADKLRTVVKGLILAFVFMVACFCLWGFILDAIQTMPVGSSLYDVLLHICVLFIRNILISACICFVLTSLIRLVKYIIIRN